MPALTVNSVEVAFAYDAAAGATPAEQLDSLVDSGYIVLPAGNLLAAVLPPVHIKTAADMGPAWNGPAGSHGVQYKVLRYIFAKVVKFSDSALSLGGTTRRSTRRARATPSASTSSTPAR